MEGKMRETEALVARIMAESDKRSLEAERLKADLLKARLAEKEAKEKLLQFLSEPAVVPHFMMRPPSPQQQLQHHQHQLHSPQQQHQQHQHQQPSLSLKELMALTTSPLPSSSPSSPSLQQQHHHQPSHHHHQQHPPPLVHVLNHHQHLMNVPEEEMEDPLLAEIEKERVEYVEKSKCLAEQLRDLKKEIEGLKVDETPFDLLHQQQVNSGENKYSTLRKVSSPFDSIHSLTSSDL